MNLDRDASWVLRKNVIQQITDAIQTVETLKQKYRELTILQRQRGY